MKPSTFISTAAAATATGPAPGRSGTPRQRGGTAQAEGRTTVEFWGNVFATPEDAWYEQIVEDFNAAQEDVYITFQVVPGDAWDQKLKAAQAAGNAPDLYIQAGRLDTAARTGTLMPLRSEEHTSELQSRGHLVCRLLLEKKKKTTQTAHV